MPELVGDLLGGMARDLPALLIRMSTLPNVLITASNVF